jgi:hypothetical protein
MKDKYPDMSIIEKKYSDTLFWTFNIKEDKTNFIKDIETFTQYSYDDLVSKLTYVNVDTIHLNYSTFRKIVKKIKSADKITYFIHNQRMLYLSIDKIIFGIDLDLYDFIGIDIKRLKNKFKEMDSSTLLSDEILIEYKEYITRLNDNVKYIPYVYSINHE